MKNSLWAVGAMGILLLASLVSAASVDVSYEIAPSQIVSGGIGQVIVTVTNAGLYDITKLRLGVRGNQDGISISGSSNSEFGVIEVGETRSSAFTITVSRSVDAGTYTVEVRGDYSSFSGGDYFVVNVPITVVSRPNIEIVANELSLQAGETGDLTLRLTNLGHGNIHDATVILSSSGDVYPTETVSRSIALIQKDGYVDVTFPIKASDSATVGITPVTIAVEYIGEGGSTESFETSVGVSVGEGLSTFSIENIVSTLQPGRNGELTLELKNTGQKRLENIEVQLDAGASVTILGATEVRLNYIDPGASKLVTFNAYVDNQAESKPISSTVTIKYSKGGGGNILSEEKSIGIEIGGEVILSIIDVAKQSDSSEIEIDVANKGNKDAEAVRVRVREDGSVLGTKYTNTIKANNHKVFKFDMPKHRQLIVEMSYKDYNSPDNIATTTETIDLSGDMVDGGGPGVLGALIPVVIIVVILVLYMRRHGKKFHIDVSKYKTKK